MTIIQKPNKLIIAAFIGFIISKMPNEILQKAGSSVFTVLLCVWAYQELVGGVNLFRKLLGLIVLILIFLSLFKVL